MHSIQIADETFVAADGARVGAAVADRASWRRWWPDLRLQVVEDRGDKGIRWSVTGALTGTMEVWLEPLKEGWTASCCTTSCTPSQPGWPPGSWPS